MLVLTLDLFVLIWPEYIDCVSLVDLVLSAPFDTGKVGGISRHNWEELCCDGDYKIDESQCGTGFDSWTFALQQMLPVCQIMNTNVS